jgi:hypothetical protein
MRVIIPTLAGLVALTAVSVQAAPVPTNPHQHAKRHETPAQNVHKSQQYDHLVAANSSYRASRMRKECGPIRDAELHAAVSAHSMNMSLGKLTPSGNSIAQT